MTGVKSTVYRPNKAAAKVYSELYGLYSKLHDSFGGVSRKVALDCVMKDLIALRDRVRKGGR